jgi:hypothetical protein
MCQFRGFVAYWGVCRDEDRSVIFSGGIGPAGEARNSS